MEVCDVDTVDFVEAQFSQRPCAAFGDTESAAAAAARYKGRIRVCGYTEDPDTWTIQYSPPVEDLADATLPEAPPSLPVLEESVWWLTGFYPRTVLRNRAWWDTVGWPAAQLFWAEVESLRLAADTTTVAPTTIRHEGGWLGRT